MASKIEQMMLRLAGTGPHPADLTPIRTALINMLGGAAAHQVEAMIAAALPEGGISVQAVATKPATTGVIVYAAGSNIIRKVILPDDDSQLGTHKPVLSAGELSITAPLSQEIDLAAVKAAVVQATGKQVPSGRTVMIDQTNTVAGVIQADPALDQLLGFTLISSDLANPGDTFKAKDGSFLRLVATVDAVTNTVVAIGLQTVGAFMVAPGFYLSDPTGVKVGTVLTPRDPATLPK